MLDQDGPVCKDESLDSRSVPRVQGGVLVARCACGAELPAGRRGPGRCRSVCDECAAKVRRDKERRRNVDPDRPEPTRIRLPRGASLRERFWVKVERSGDCLLWTGTRNGRGYGLFRVDSTKTARAHRVAYELVMGEIPAGMQLDHLCGVKACVNPSHLEPVTNEENSRRARARRALMAER